MGKKPAKKTLVVVESPTKAKTIEKYLGRKYMVRASKGHLRDLPKSQFGIDVEHDFTPKYINIRGKGDIIKSLRKDAKQASKVYLASDPDREGEAISWHLAHILGLDPATDCRIVFHEITKGAIRDALKEPRPIDMDRVDAQQARRMLDRIVGYELSPLLWRKIRKGLSAGRVQSVTVKLICDREREIEAFTSVEYWTIGIKLRAQTPPLIVAELYAIDGEKPVLSNQKDAEEIAKALEASTFTVKAIEKKRRQRKPPAPFTTSSLQQDAAHRLGFTSKRTMAVAQQLYEGVSLGQKGMTGLITYMRTDSTRIADVAQTEARSYLQETWGADYVPAKPNVYVAAEKAQDAHEAIRPTSVLHEPQKISQYLTDDQAKLYTLIWQRFLASQMTCALFDTERLTIAAGSRFLCRAAGSVLAFAGFLAIYQDAGKQKDTRLPEVATDEVLKLSAVVPAQHFTEPPPRYNEASLVKTLEEQGIGRPSTYAPIIETITARGYVTRKGKQFFPTELGFLVNDLLEKYFQDIVDAHFTAGMERQLDEVAEGKLGCNKLLHDFYEPFSQTLAKADKDIGEVKPPVEESDVICEKCGRRMVVKIGRFGRFLACPGFPECRNTKPLLKDTGVRCPKCGGHIVERRSKKGRMFYGCDHYPACDYVVWDKPTTETCKTCGAFLLEHRYKDGRKLLYCSNEQCKSRENHPIQEVLRRRAARMQADKEKEELVPTESVPSKKSTRRTKPKEAKA